MIKVQTGQIHWIGEEETFGKVIKRKKIRMVLSQGNVLMDRIEYIVYDFIDDKMDLIKDLWLSVGNNVEVQYQDIGRLYYRDENPVPEIHNNKEIIKIEII